jgi:hypothetical protein
MGMKYAAFILGTLLYRIAMEVAAISLIGAYAFSGENAAGKGIWSPLAQNDVPLGM